MEKLYVPLVVAVLGVMRGVAAATDGGGDPSIKWVQMHGWLMWASMGFLFPLGTILIRYSRPQGSPNAILSPGQVTLLFYFHCVVQFIALFAATAGVAILFSQTGTNMDCTHNQLGMALLIIVMLQPFIGVLRPGKGTKWRAYWFVIHWVLGTGVLFLGFINCYTGINAYRYIAKGSLRSFTIAFSIQVSVTLLIYFLQDRWSYILGQRFSKITLPLNAGRYQIDMNL